MKLFKSALRNIEFQIAGREYSFVTFHYSYFDESISELKKKENEIKTLCRSLLVDVYSFIEMLSGYKITDTNMYVIPQFKYGSTFDKKNSFFEVTYSLGKTKTNSRQLELFHVNLLFNPIGGGLNTLEYGRFNIELQTYTWNNRENYLDVAINDEALSYFNSKLVQLSMPLRNIVVNISDKMISKIVLLDGEVENEIHSKGEYAIVSEALLIEMSSEEEGRISVAPQKN